MFMKMARAASQRSTCHRLNVGAILVLENNVIATGYNGAVSGAPHCGGTDCQYFERGACTVVHAEENAIQRLALTAFPDTLYVTHSPCMRCAEMLVKLGVQAVYFEVPYRKPQAIDFMVENGIDVYQLTPGGYRVNQKTLVVEQL